MRDRRSEPDPSLVDGQTPAQIVAPFADLLARPNGPRDRQVLMGDGVRVFSVEDGWAYVIADKDGYVGFVPSHVLGPPEAATHRVSARATHVYEAANIKSPDVMSLSFGAQVAALSETPLFVETKHGFIPKAHLAPAGTLDSTPVSVAELFLGAPYLWGGNTSHGLDCSALVQTALLACGYACPGDSDQQEAQLDAHLPAGSEYRAGDLLFWKGHVALLRDAETLIHANAYHMAVAYEPVAEAIARIETQGDGPVTAHIRLESRTARGA